MSNYTFKKAMMTELRKLNEEIDKKIVKGLSYIKEARRHKSILRQLDKLEKRKNSFHFFQKSFNLISTFLL